MRTPHVLIGVLRGPRGVRPKTRVRAFLFVLASGRTSVLSIPVPILQLVCQIVIAPPRRKGPPRFGRAVARKKGHPARDGPVFCFVNKPYSLPKRDKSACVVLRAILGRREGEATMARSKANFSRYRECRTRTLSPMVWDCTYTRWIPGLKVMGCDLLRREKILRESRFVKGEFGIFSVFTVTRLWMHFEEIFWAIPLQTRALRARGGFGGGAREKLSRHARARARGRGR